MYECRAIDSPEALRQHYPLIEEACMRLRLREGRDHFAPEVYRALMAGEGRGHVVLRDGVEVGFFAVQPTQDAEGRAALQLWLGYARPGEAGAFETGLRECEAIARDQGRATLVLATGRRGWLRHAPQFGFELREFIFEKQVMYGRESEEA